MKTILAIYLLLSAIIFITLAGVIFYASASIGPGFSFGFLSGFALLQIFFRLKYGQWIDLT